MAEIRLGFPLNSTGKATSAYLHMDDNKSVDYDQVKSAILQMYDINKETHCQKFSSLSMWYQMRHPKSCMSNGALWKVFNHKVKLFTKVLKLLYLNSTKECYPQNFRFGSRRVIQKLQKRPPSMYLWLLKMLEKGQPGSGCSPAKPSRAKLESCSP